MKPIVKYEDRRIRILLSYIKIERVHLHKITVEYSTFPFKFIKNRILLSRLGRFLCRIECTELIHARLNPTQRMCT